jgi:hypothetical protein
MDRQAANILRQNSENKINSVPRMSVYIKELELDKTRLADQTFIGRKNIRERGVSNGRYNSSTGRNYTIERIMPTPFNLTMNVDIWTANTDQKLQLLEQILVLFNPSLEIQTNDNYIDWSNISVLNLKNIVWSSKSVPVGTDSPIDIGTLTLDTPIWINPPVKVKQLGIVTNIITSLYSSAYTSKTGYIEGLGTDAAHPTVTMQSLMEKIVTTITDYKIEVYNGVVMLLESSLQANNISELPTRHGSAISWLDVFNKYPDQFHAGVSRLYLVQQDGNEIVGTVSLNESDQTQLLVEWDPDSLILDTLIDTNGYMYGDSQFDQTTARSKVDAIIDPTTYNPKRPLKESADQPIPLGIRYLIIEDIGNESNVDGADAWKSLNGDDLVAHANDLIEWDGERWKVIFDSINENDTMVWQTNIYTGVQYLWNGAAWVISFEGIYDVGYWRLEL